MGNKVIGLSSEGTWWFATFGRDITVPCFQALGNVPVIIEQSNRCLIISGITLNACLTILHEITGMPEALYMCILSISLITSPKEN